MTTLLILLSGALLTGVILLQNPKGTPAPIIQFSGASRGAHLLSKSTWILAVITFGCTLLAG